MAFPLGGRLLAVTVIAAVFAVCVGGSGFWFVDPNLLTVETGMVGAAVFMGSLGFSISVPGGERSGFFIFFPFCCYRGRGAGHVPTDELRVV